MLGVGRVGRRCSGVQTRARDGADRPAPDRPRDRHGRAARGVRLGGGAGAARAAAPPRQVGDAHRRLRGECDRRTRRVAVRPFRVPRPARGADVPVPAPLLGRGLVRRDVRHQKPPLVFKEDARALDHDQGFLPRRDDHGVLQAAEGGRVRRRAHGARVRVRAPARFRARQAERDPIGGENNPRRRRERVRRRGVQDGDDAARGRGADVRRPERPRARERRVRGRVRCRGACAG